MNWGIYEKRKKLIIWALIVNVLIVVTALILPAFGRSSCNCSSFTKDKSRLKQIGTTIAMYFTDGEPYTYPKTPKDLDIDKVIVNNAVQDSWKEISRTSPYYFFPENGSIYTGSAEKPLAVRKIPVKNYEHCHIVFEDGHVESITPKTAKAYIQASELLKIQKRIFLKKRLKHIRDSCGINNADF